MELTIQYPQTVGEENENSLRFSYYNEELGSWVGIPISIDTKSNTFSAKIDHFTLFGYDFNNLQSLLPANVQAFQTAEFTGAGTYAYSFNIPPAPGGLQPALGLGYNSQIADSMAQFTGAPPTGLGWNLTGIGYIMRNVHTDPNSTADDTFTLVMDGVSSRLLKASDHADGTRWHTEDESFFNIIYTSMNISIGDELQDISTWTVKDKLGNTYRFEAVARYPQFLVDLNQNCPNHETGMKQLAWYYGLTEITDKYNNKVKINWANDGRTYYYSCGPNLDDDQTGFQHDAYPVSIEYPYPNPKYRIEFIYNTNDPGIESEKRGDWDNNAMQQELRFYSARFMKTVRVTDLSSSPAKIVREYNLGFDLPKKDVSGYTALFPNIKRQPKFGDIQDYYGILTLRSITEKVGNPNNLPTSPTSAELRALPATTFTYTGAMHLTEVSNGMGGKVRLTYESSPWYTKATPTDPQVLRNINSYSGGGYFWLWVPATGHRFGGWYKLESTLNTVPDNGTWEADARYYFIDEHGTQTMSETFTITETAKLQSGYVYVPPTAFNGYFYLYAPVGDGMYAADFKAYPLVTRYRVTQREVVDERSVTNPNQGLSTVTEATTYGYSGPTVNNVLNSNPEPAYEPLQVEYRGNEIVSATDPYGLTKYTFYNQTKDLKGMPVTTFTQSMTFADAMSNYSVNWGRSGNGSASVEQVVDPYSGNGAVKIVGNSASAGIASLTSPAGVGDMFWTKFQVSGSEIKVDIFGYSQITFGGYHYFKYNE